MIKQLGDSKDPLQYTQGIQKILGIDRSDTAIVFRKEQYWYAFRHWKLPGSGILLRSKVVKDTWAPQFFSNFDRSTHWETVFNVRKLSNEDMYEGRIEHVIFSSDFTRYALVRLDKHGYLLQIGNASEYDALITIHGVDMKSGVILNKDEFYYCRVDKQTGLQHVMRFDLTHHNEYSVFTEPNFERRILIQEISNNGVLIVSSTLISSKIYRFIPEEHEVRLIFNNNHYFVSKFQIEIENLERLGVCYKPVNDLYVIDIIDQLTGELLKKINIFENEIRNVSGQGSDLIIEVNKKSNSRFFCINIELMLRNQVNNVYEFSQFFKTHGDGRIYQNNYSGKYLYIFKNDGINSEKLYEIDLTSFKTHLVFTKSTMSHFNDDISVRNTIHKQIKYVQSQDMHTQIPISLYWSGPLQEKRVPRHHNVIINVYGAYGKRELVGNLDNLMIAIIECGFTLAIAHVRGGGYYGGKWYRDGKRLLKWNSINDFIDCCTWLKKQKIAKNIGGLAASAGGIIVGATLNSKPDLLDAALLFSPFVNPYGAMMKAQHDSISKREIIEWGDPTRSEQIADYILSYSPLQNSVNVKHVHSLLICVVMGGLDKLVSNLDTDKWIANLLNSGASANVIFNQVAGHGGITNTDYLLLSKIVSKFLNALRG